MFYPYMTLNDETEITHSGAVHKDGKEIVEVYMEKPIQGGFATASCFLPDYRWENVQGFSEEELAHLKDIVESGAAIIIELARTGGIYGNAANF